MGTNVTHYKHESHKLQNESMELKYKTDGSVERCKFELVVKGIQRISDLDNDETFDTSYC